MKTKRKPRMVRELQAEYQIATLPQKENQLEPFLNKIICGDNLALLKEIPSNTINLVITSPPYYKQRDYGSGIGNEKTVEEYITNLLKVFHECVRIITKDGSIVFNLGDKYEDANLLLVPYRFALAVTQSEPVRLVNNITWIKRNPTPRQFQRRLVSSTEPFFHFVKSDTYYYKMNAFMYHLDLKNKSHKGNGNNIGKKYFGLIEQSTLSDAEKKMAREELQTVIQEAKSGKINSFRMKIRGIHISQLKRHLYCLSISKILVPPQYS